MAQSTTPQVPAPMSTVWPPSNPSGTVIPFPLPWGQTGCCPPGGMDALMKCYCDIQQASAFIGQIMLDQINNNPAIIAAIIAGIEASGSSLPTVGVTNGTDAQPGQVGEWSVLFQAAPYTTAAQIQQVNMGILQPGDWDYWLLAVSTTFVNDIFFQLQPVPAGFTNNLYCGIGSPSGAVTVSLVSTTARALTSVPSLVNVELETNQSSAGSSAGTMNLTFMARRRR